MSNHSKENHKKLKFHQTCQTLPLRRWINLQNSVDENGVADARHLLVDEVWPEGYEDSELIIVYDRIRKEWNKLNGEEINEEQLYYEKDAHLYDMAKMQCLDCAHRMIGVSEVWEFQSIIAGAEGLEDYSRFLENESKELRDNANDLLKNYGFKLSSKQDIEQKYKQISQKVINNVKEKRREFKKINLVFEDFIIPIATTFKMNPVDLYDITCAMYISFVNRMKKMNELNKDG